VCAEGGFAIAPVEGVRGRVVALEAEQPLGVVVVVVVVVLVSTASVQDRDGGRLVLDEARVALPSIALV